MLIILPFFLFYHLLPLLATYTLYFTPSFPDAYFDYGNFFSSVNASEDLLPYYQSDYLTEAFKFDHGRIMSEFHLMGDGQVIYGEPYVYQYGLTTDMFWSQLYDLGYSVADYVKLPMLNHSLDRYDWMCCQFTTNFIDIGLRHDVTNTESHYVAVMFDELAARSDWAVLPASQCNHAPIVSAEKLDITAKAGETVTLKGNASDPDGDKLTAKWWAPNEASAYEGADALKITGDSTLSASVTIPKDAVSGNRFVVNLEVQDDAARPMTRFAQVVITIK